MAVMQKPRLFPIMGERPGSARAYIPWDLMAPHEGQALRNHTQTLDKLAQRGGLDPAEAVAVLEDRECTVIPYGAALLRLGEIVAERTAVLPHHDAAYMLVPRCDSCAWWRAFAPDLQPAAVGGIVDTLKAEGLLEDADLLGRLSVRLGDCTLFETHACEPVHEEAMLQTQRTGSGNAVIVTVADFGCVQWRVSTRCTYQSDPADPQTRCILQVHEGGEHSCPDWPGRKDGVR